MTEIRRARREDHDDLLDLWMEAGHGRMSEEEWDAIIARPSTTVLVAEDAGEWQARRSPPLTAGGRTSTTSR